MHCLFLKADSLYYAQPRKCRTVKCNVVELLYANGTYVSMVLLMGFLGLWQCSFSSRAVVDSVELLVCSSLSHVEAVPHSGLFFFFLVRLVSSAWQMSKIQE